MNQKKGCFAGKDAADAVDGGSDKKKPVCEICGAQCERKRRRDGSWYHYGKCRACRRLPQHTHLLGNTIPDQRLSTLVFALYHHLIVLKQGGWQSTPKSQVVYGLRMLLGILKED
jgi:hypothetical protein